MFNKNDMKTIGQALTLVASGKCDWIEGKISKNRDILITKSEFVDAISLTIWRDRND